ncbi:MAG: SLC13 family permease [Anaerolineales bacterium]|nr:MAG: SLC13 family permease [Anaerolineales bacterium]
MGEQLTPEIVQVLIVVGGALLLLISERIRVDVIALMVLGTLAMIGLVTPTEALSGFSSPAVITVWAVFIMSGALARSGIANRIGRQVLRVAGNGEARLIAAIMLSAGLMSAFLNNVGVAALMLPVVMDISRRTGRAPSRLLIPLAYGSLLGGLTTLIGTPPNILVNEVLSDAGLQTFNIFDFSPVGFILLIAGVLFMSLIGRHLLPDRNIHKALAQTPQELLEDVYDVEQRLFLLCLPVDSPLSGKSLVESRVGAALGLQVIAILRETESVLSPTAGTILQDGDRLLVEGRFETVLVFQHKNFLDISDDTLDVGQLFSAETSLCEVTLSSDTNLIGRTLFESGFRKRFGMNVLAIKHDGFAQRTNLQGKLLFAGDALLLQGTLERLEEIRNAPEWSSFRYMDVDEVNEHYELFERIRIMSVPEGSSLSGKTLAESRLADAFGICVLGIRHENRTDLTPDVDHIIQDGDQLLVEVWPEDLKVLQGLQGLEVTREGLPDLKTLQSEQVGLYEVVLSPHTTLDGKTLRELHFREKYSLSVLAVWRGGRPYRSQLRDMQLRFGDALLLYGLRDSFKVLGTEPDFLVLTEEAQQAPRIEKAPLALLILFAFVASVFLGILPIALAAVIGATVMVLTGVLSMEEAYRYIDWKSVFLIAGMLPLGIALQQTGAAELIAQGLLNAAGKLGPFGIMGGLFLLTAVTSQIMPNAAVTVLMAPIAISASMELGISPLPFAMIVAISASSSFLSPVAHPANSLIMGPGGYRVTDFIKVGIPLTIVILLITLLILPFFWPF